MQLRSFENSEHDWVLFRPSFGANAKAWKPKCCAPRWHPIVQWGQWHARGWMEGTGSTLRNRNFSSCHKRNRVSWRCSIAICFHANSQKVPDAQRKATFDQASQDQQRSIRLQICRRVETLERGRTLGKETSRARTRIWGQEPRKESQQGLLWLE